MSRRTECPECLGSGLAPNRKDYCKRCGGIGQVPGSPRVLTRSG